MSNNRPSLDKQVQATQDSPLHSPLYTALLKIVNHTESQAELENGFTEIAKILLLESTLIAGGKPYQLMEVEFYFYEANFHPDPYSHAFQYASKVRQKQSVTGAWYFHRFTGMAQYTHTRRGLDLTYGNGHRERYGGILIRSIRSLEDDRIIPGPSRVVGEIIAAINNPEEVEKIGFNNQAGYAFNVNSGLRLISSIPPLTLLVYSTPRFGLSSKDPFYQQKHYRYLTYMNPGKGQDSKSYRKLPYSPPAVNP